MVVLVAERVGERLHRCVAGDLVAGDVQRPVDLRKRERPTGPDEDAERGVAQLLAPERVRRRCRTPDGFGTAYSRTAVSAPPATVDRGPDRVAETHELAPDRRHAPGETLVPGVDVAGFGDQVGTGGEQLVPTRWTAATSVVVRHEGFLRVMSGGGGSG
jgi:hypothetical protein